MVRWRVGDLRGVPLAVALQGLQDLLRVRIDQVGPGLPQRVNDVVDESDLGIEDEKPVWEQVISDSTIDRSYVPSSEYFLAKQIC